MKGKTAIQCLLALAFLSKTSLGQSAPDHSVVTASVLPVPSGSYAIGRQLFEWIDPSRVDEFSPAAGKHRELMVSIWYPAQPSQGLPRAEYFPGARGLAADPAAEQAARDIFGAPWDQIAAGSLRSHAATGAAPVTNSGTFPVILFSHGSSASTFSYTAQIEAYVSHGYVVVAIEHPNLAGLVRFPDGHVRLYHDPPPSTSSAKDPMQAAISSAKAGTQTGAEDLRFVLDTLARGETPLAEIMDLKRVAAVGHSAGGTVTVRACQIDPRIRSCISEEGEVNPVGFFFDYPDHARMTQPALFIEMSEQHTDEELARMRESRAQWNSYLEHGREQLASCAAGSYHVVINKPGMTHSSFSDGPVLNAVPGSAEAAVALSNLELTEELEQGFLDNTPKIKDAPAFDRVARSSSVMKVEPIGQSQPDQRSRNADR